MKKVGLLTVSALLVFSFLNLAMAEDTEQYKGNSRYLVYEAEIDKKQTPILLDTKTGKIWIYQDVGGGLISKKKFVGVTVEGIAYSTNEIEDLEKQISQWSVEGLVDKNTKGFKERMLSEFSYSSDAKKATAISEELKAAKR